MKKKKTFKELFAGTGIEPTTNENGGVEYNFNATLKNKPMKLYTEEQVKNFLKERTFIREETIDAMCDTLTPIELPSHRDVTERATQQVDKTIDNYFVGFAACSEYYEQILNQNK